MSKKFNTGIIPGTARSYEELETLIACIHLTYAEPSPAVMSELRRIVKHFEVRFSEKVIQEPTLHHEVRKITFEQFEKVMNDFAVHFKFPSELNTTMGALSREVRRVKKLVLA